MLEVESLHHIVRSLPAAATVKQSANSVLMVVPVGFGYNAETAADNSFMHKATAEQVEGTSF